MRHRQEAVLFPRRYTLKNGNRVVVWWYSVTTPTGQRVRFTLATNSKTKARYLLDRKTKSGELIPVKQPVLRLQEFARDFWVWDRCNYIKGRLMRRERISRGWACQGRVCPRPFYAGLRTNPTLVLFRSEGKPASSLFFALLP